MNFILFDDDQRSNFLPLSFTRPLCEFRIGINTIIVKWKKVFNDEFSSLTEDYLSVKFPVVYKNENTYINGRLIPDFHLVDRITNLKEGDVLVQNSHVLAIRTSRELSFPISSEHTKSFNKIEYDGDSFIIENITDVFSKNAEALKRDFRLMTQNRVSCPIPTTNNIIGDPNLVFLDEGAKVNGASLNTESGPIYIGKHAEIMEGSLVRGPFTLCDNSTLKMGAKVYGPTTIGPHSKVGGEVNNTVIFGYTNKAHDGFIGNSVIGEWCNLGADTNTSNLKNNYADVKLWNYEKSGFKNTGMMFCGLIMGDHSKSAINTQFNTGTVIGVSCNIFGAGFPRNYIPSYSWGGAQGVVEYKLEKTFVVAEKVYARRGLDFNDTERGIMTEVYEKTAPFRR